MSGGVGRICGSDLALLWLWCWLAAVAPIPPLVWELPYATGAAVKRQKKLSAQMNKWENLNLYRERQPIEANV